MDQAKIMKHINDNIARISNIDNPAVYVDELTKFLSTLHPSDAYVIIRDTIVPAKNGKIKSCKSVDMYKYQVFQDLMQRCKQSFDHDRAFATNLDVDKAVSKAYGIAMRTLRANMDMEQARFDKLTQAINRIEERLGLDVTDFKEGESNDTTEYENASNIEGSTAETGEPC